MKVTQARAEIQGPIISDYTLRKVDSPRELILLLHGFQQSGHYLFSKLAAACPEDAAILAPNGPFPLPERRPDGSYRLGFSWYLYDPSHDEYYIDMRVALRLLEGLVESLGFASLPKRLVGFSQGGYLAPFAALKLGGVTQVVGVASEFLAQELQPAEGLWPPSFRMDSVHGENDEIVKIESARQNHGLLKSLGVSGEFRALAGQAHRLTPEIQAAVKGVLESNR